MQKHTDRLLYIFSEVELLVTFKTDRIFQLFTNVCMNWSAEKVTTLNLRIIAQILTSN